VRILLVSFIKNSQTSGMGKWTHRVAYELGRSGCEVELWFQDDFPELALKGRVGRQVFPLELARRLVARRASFDAVVVHEPSSLGYGLLRRRFKHLPPLVVVTFGVESRVFRQMAEANHRGLANVSRWSSLRHLAVRRWQSDGGLRLADHVVCPSGADREYLIARLGLDPATISIAISGADASPKISDPASMRVAFIGSWIAEKGSRAIPLIWKIVSAALPQARLQLLGTGASAAEVGGAFPEDLRRTVDVLSDFPDQETLAKRVRGAALFLLPSMREGSPLALVEAMAMGLTPVVSRVGGVPEILGSELASLAFERFDLRAAAAQVVSLLSEPERSGQIGSRARERAGELTWSKTASVVEFACHLAGARPRSQTASSLRPGS